MTKVYEFKNYVTYDTLVNFFTLTKTVAIEDDKNYMNTLRYLIPSNQFDWFSLQNGIFSYLGNQIFFSVVRSYCLGKACLYISEFKTLENK